ncbi:tRNA 2-thiouridine(34) synthase MnmA, partial [bacterium]|nr:tRNA 2-thiouridine(34) synthase MnmA [bacterium]
GEVIDETGCVLGEHRGYPFYTIGQRKGLRVSAGKRIFVNRIDPENNRVYVGPKEMVLAHGLIADSANWSAIARTDAVLPVQVKIRYNDPGTPATLRAISDDQIEVVFENPQKSVTPGQSVVCYQDDIVIAGGIITAAL